MNNPVRAGIQRWYEVPLLKDMGGSAANERVLEIGCGRGIGTRHILRSFAAASVVSIDLDPLMVANARKRLTRFGSRVDLRLGDASCIEFADESFGAVFDFGIIHHIEDWPGAVSEVARVLRPGGRFYFEEVTKHALERWSYRTFLDHPTENRFTSEEWTAQLAQTGFCVDGAVERFFGDFVIGVAHKESAPRKPEVA